ncbi:MAG: glycosyltransferase [Pseudomonadota bacterium]
MRVLTVTTLYPNAAAPTHGVFVENRMADFQARTGAEVRVIAPVPWFPFDHVVFGRYATFARAPAQETRRGVKVSHPRYAIPPKVGMTYAASALERAIRKAVRDMIDQGDDFDVIDAHYLYPDGVAAARVAAELGKPLILTARGSDVTQLPSFPRQRGMILSAIGVADTVICVAQALKDELVRLGAPAEKIRVLRNGVDLQLFRPLDRDAARAALGANGPVIASVGHLVERKGHDLVIDAVALLPNATLLVVGDGPERSSLEERARDKGVADRVRFLGARAHEALPEIYTAADALALGSTREGWPNVLLEAMACGAPAVAAPVWGCGEVIAEEAAGRLASERSPAAFAEALNETLKPGWDRSATRSYAEQFSWRETSEGLRDVFSAAIERSARARLVSQPPSAKRVRIAPMSKRPRMIVTVDTEEAFDWAEFRRDAHWIAPPTDFDPFQAICQRYGATPLCFLSHPIITDALSSEYFRNLKREGLADLGLHLHQWATPPDQTFEGEFYSWQKNLPPRVHLEKLTALATAFERAFGERAISHRAGRYGVSVDSYVDLAAIGVRHDFSPSPSFNFSQRGGPDFTTMSNQPFPIEVDGVRTIWVTPASGAHGRRGGPIFTGGGGEPGFPSGGPKRAPMLTSPLRLTPEGPSVMELKNLARHLLSTGARVLVYSLHSTTLTPGGNNYASDQSVVERVLSTTDDFFKSFTEELGGEMISLSDYDVMCAAADRSR